MGANGAGTNGQADAAEEVGLDRTHPQEDSIQHHTRQEQPRRECDGGGGGGGGGSLVAYAPLGAMGISKILLKKSLLPQSRKSFLKENSNSMTSSQISTKDKTHH